MLAFLPSIDIFLTEFMSIFVIDEHPLMREAVGSLVRRLNHTVTVIELGNIGAVIPAAEAHGLPQLICIEPIESERASVSGLRELRHRFPDVPIVVLTANNGAEFRELSTQAGASAVVHKSANASEISNVLRGFLDEEAGAEGSGTPEKLSKRQKQLLTLLDKGMSNRDIAESLQISEHTVKVHLWRLFRRLNVKSRSQASHLARTQGLL